MWPSVQQVGNHQMFHFRAVRLWKWGVVTLRPPYQTRVNMFILIDVLTQIIRSLVLIMCCDALVSAPEGQLWWVLYRLVRIIQGEFISLILDYSTSCQLLARVSTLLTHQNLTRWVHNTNIRLTLPVTNYWHGFVLYRLFIIFESECIIVCYKCPIMKLLERWTGSKYDF